MTSLVRKKIGGKAYYYARECQRVDGRPKIVWQTRTLPREIGKRQRRLQELQRSLRAGRRRKGRGGKPATVSGTQKKVAGWLKARHMKELFHVEVREQDGRPTLTYRFDHAA